MKMKTSFGVTAASAIVRAAVAILVLALLLRAGPVAAATTTYIYTDQQGTPLVEADASGKVIANFDYRPYGSAYAGSGMANVVDGPGYTGHVNDADTAFVYMQARYYDPALGRFLSVDPIEPSGGAPFAFNRYNYANNNPSRFTDPDGMCPDKNPCHEATPYNWYRSTPDGIFLGHLIGDPIAVFRSDGYNPLRNEFLDRGQLQDAKLGLLTVALPIGAAERGSMEIVRESNVLANGLRGRASEARVLRDLGLTKNTSAVSTAEGRSIPDALTGSLSIEIKDAARVNFTRQLRIQTESARSVGRQSILVTGENTCVSASCSRAFDTIIRRTDLGPW